MAHRVSKVWKVTECCATAGTVAHTLGAVSPMQLDNAMKLHICSYIPLIKLMLVTFYARTENLYLPLLITVTFLSFALCV